MRYPAVMASHGRQTVPDSELIFTLKTNNDEKV